MTSGFSDGATILNVQGGFLFVNFRLIRLDWPRLSPTDV